MTYKARNPHVLMLLLLVPAGLAASQPWARKDPQQWTTEDVSHLLLDSPWAQQTGVTFGIKPEEEYVPPQLPGAAEWACRANNNQTYIGTAGWGAMTATTRLR